VISNSSERKCGNTDNSIEEEIEYGIKLGNKAYYFDQFFFKSRLVVSKKSKLKLYCSIIRPTAKCGCEAWVLKGTIKHRLMVFERKVLRRIFGPTKKEMVHGESKRTIN
jgi:hypothetical protein